MLDRIFKVAGRGPAADESPSADVEYHMRRALAERATADRATNAFAADAHMRLSELHLERALTLQAVRRRTVGNVHPFRSPVTKRDGPAATEPPLSLE
jgi:hypothetical protein